LFKNLQNAFLKKTILIQIIVFQVSTNPAKKDINHFHPMRFIPAVQHPSSASNATDAQKIDRIFMESFAKPEYFRGFLIF